MECSDHLRLLKRLAESAHELTATRCWAPAASSTKHQLYHSADVMFFVASNLTSGDTRSWDNVAASCRSYCERQHLRSKWSNLNCPSLFGEARCPVHGARLTVGQRSRLVTFKWFPNPGRQRGAVMAVNKALELGLWDRCIDLFPVQCGLFTLVQLRLGGASKPRRTHPRRIMASPSHARPVDRWNLRQLPGKLLQPPEHPDQALPGPNPQQLHQSRAEAKPD